MNRENAEGMVVIAGAGVAAFLLYQIYQTIKAPIANAAGAANTAYQATTQAIANLFPGTSSSVIPQGSVSLPNGTTVPVSSLTSQGIQSDGTLSMTDASGNTYTVQSGDVPGTYVATTPIVSGLGRFRSGGLR